MKRSETHILEFSTVEEIAADLKTRAFGKFILYHGDEIIINGISAQDVETVITVLEEYLPPKKKQK